VVAGEFDERCDDGFGCLPMVLTAPTSEGEEAAGNLAWHGGGSMTVHLQLAEMTAFSAFVEEGKE